MRVSDFDFDLPQDLIALRPAVPREAARLLVVREGSLEFGEATLRDLPGLLNPGDLCIYNETVSLVELAALVRSVAQRFGL